MQSHRRTTWSTSAVRSISIAAAVALGTFALAGCSVDAETPEGAVPDVHIAAVLPLSGAIARQGTLQLEGAQLAVDEINEAGGIEALGGAQLVLDVEDAGATVEDAVSAANRALSGALPAAGVGAWASSLTLGVTEVSERAHVPWVTLSFADSITDRGFHYVFQSSPVASQIATTGLSDFLEVVATGGDEVKRVALVGDNTAASAAFLDAVQNVSAPNLDLEVVTRQDWTPPLTDASGIASALRSAAPDAIIFTSVSLSDTTLVLNALSQFDIHVPFIANGAGILLPEYLEGVGADAMEGITTIVGSNPGKNSDDLVARFVEASGEPWMTQDAISGYSEIWIIKEALEAAGSADPEDVAEALRGLDISEGPAAQYLSGGRVRFDEVGHRTDAAPVLVQWQHGVPVTIWPEDVAVATPQVTG
jgi:branched-chain amino acid transport system substrate-binding protein